MKQSLQLRLGQQLTMTPQLQQAIRLLQLSALELQVEVQEALDSNLMLEVSDEQNQDNGVDDSLPLDDLAAASPEAPDRTRDNEIELGKKSDIPDDLPVDTHWDDIYDIPRAGGQAEESEEREFQYGSGPSESLRDHLLWQVQMRPLSERDLAIVTTLIDSINEDGYLRADLALIAQEFIEPEDEADAGHEEIEAMLHLLQSLEPAGVGARDLQECLSIQLRQLPPDTPYRETALRLVDEHLQLLAGNQQAQLMRKLKVDEEALQQAILLVRSLNPHPGEGMRPDTTQYVVPDVIVFKREGAWQVRLNAEAAPKLRINPNYANLVRRADNSADNTCLKNHLQEARWLLKSLQSRNETLLKVASSIVERQQGFLEHGEIAMKPMVLRDVAEEVEMHESTISRVTTQKYMHTPRGIYEFKYFFSSHVGTADGGEASSTAIRALIKQLVADENPAKPLSDNKIAQLLVSEGINVARRTVAKYREAMAIAPSNERKRIL